MIKPGKSRNHPPTYVFIAQSAERPAVIGIIMVSSPALDSFCDRIEDSETAQSLGIEPGPLPPKCWWWPLYHRANVPAKLDFLWVFTREKSQKSTKENLRPWKTTHPLVDLGFSRFENNMPPALRGILWIVNQGLNAQIKDELLPSKHVLPPRILAKNVNLSFRVSIFSEQLIWRHVMMMLAWGGRH